MTRVLFAVTGADHWTLADGSRHACGFWPEELVVPHQVFSAVGYEIAIATPGGVRPVPDEAGFTPEMNGGSSEPGRRFRAYLSSIDDELAQPLDLETLDEAEFDIVFVPGGHGPMEDLAVSRPFGELLKAFDVAGKPIAAVCHGPAALLPARDENGDWLFSGRRVTGFTTVEEAQVGFAERAAWLLEDRLIAAGGHFEHSGRPWSPHVVVDENLFTGQNPAASLPLAQSLVDAAAAADRLEVTVD